MVETEEEAKRTGIGCIYAQRLAIAFVFTIAGAFLGLFLVELNKGGDVAMQIGLGLAVLVTMLFGLFVIIND